MAGNGEVRIGGKDGVFMSVRRRTRTDRDTKSGSGERALGFAALLRILSSASNSLTQWNGNACGLIRRIIDDPTEAELSGGRADAPSED
jgi:hypothetical protein